MGAAAEGHVESGAGREWSSVEHFGGLDWATEAQVVVIVDRQGRVAADLRFEDTAAGWEEFRARARQFPHLALTIETSRGPVVERLLEAGMAVYPVSPVAAAQFRKRKAPSGVKDDRLDAWSLAEALRTDGQDWRRLKPEDPQTQELRLLCRDEIALIEKRTALVNELRAALREYYPAALEAFDEWTMPAAWAFVERFPTPQTLQQKGKRQWEKFLHTHRLGRPEKYQERLEIFARATEFCGTPAVTSAKSRLATVLARQLRVLEEQIQEYRAQIERLFAMHADSDIFSSLPGAGKKLAPRLLAEFGADRERFQTPDELRCHAGAAPVTIQSGRHRRVRLRRACNKILRATVHLWADLSRKTCTWAEAYYDKKREQGQSHACALRCLAQRWLKILWKMWQTRTPYNEALHTRNQVRHGSWVVQLVQANPAPPPATTT